jgi:hypothetical protein
LEDLQLSSAAASGILATFYDWISSIKENGGRLIQDGGRRRGSRVNFLETYIAISSNQGEDQVSGAIVVDDGA